jgi:recombination protein RecR
MYPSSIRKLIEVFKYLPGIGEKSAERMAFSVINFDSDRLQEFANSILDVKNKVRRCSICNNLSEGDVCDICNSNSREKHVIVVVEKPKDVFLFEKLGIFNGCYHVLDGLISPIDGINPDDIKISSLLNRIESEEIKEIILALKPSIEGETTMQYINKLLENSEVKVTKIATGIPMGADMEYIDSLTLEMALEGRKNL